MSIKREDRFRHVTKNALEVLKARYLLRNEKGRIIENPSGMFRRVARAIALDRKQEHEFYEIMSSLEFLPNSPTLFNAGAPLKQLAACFVLPVNDSLDSIFTAVKNMALIEQTGGGVGFDFSKLRPKGDLVKSTKGVASGPVSFMRVFNAATEIIKAGGKRRGAMMAVLHVTHPDIIEFISAKNKPGELANFNISVAVTDDFMRAVRADRAYSLINPRTKQKVMHVNARKIWDKIIKNAWNTGDPGVIFIDEINRHNPTPSFGEMTGTNPCGEVPLLPYESCLASNTRITTINGLEEIESLYKNQKNGEPIIIATHLNGKNKEIIFRPAIITQIGIKPTIKIELTDKQQVQLTPDHKVYTRGGWKEAGKLTKKDEIMIQIKEAGDIIFDSTPEEHNLFQMFGWFTGDGWFTSTAGLTFGPKDEEAFKRLLPVWYEFVGNRNKVNTQKNFVRCVSVESRRAINKFKNLGFKQAKGPEKRVPKFLFTSKKQLQIAYLQGLFSADGSKIRNKSIVSLSSASLELLKDVQLLLLNLGIRSDIKFYTIRKRGSAQGNLKISGTDYIRFVDLIGFPLAVYKQDKCKEHIQQRVNKGREFIPLKEIHQAEAVCVYDVSEPVTNSLIAEGMIVHNCNLGSINMSRMVTGGRINWHKLEYTIRLAVNFLDNVIDKNKYPLSQIEQITKANRKIGLGMMGWAECLIQLGLPYDSGRAVKLAEKTMSFIQKTAREESTELADKKGNFPNFNKSSLTNKYPKMRNATVTTIAPTGSISIIAGCSSGIEPIFAVSFVRHILEGTKLFEVNPLFEKAAKERGFYSDSLLRKIARTGSLQHIRGIPPDIKRIFKTAFDINPEWHVRMQAAFQRYTDNAVSKTVNLSQNAAFNDVKKSFELAYRMKCKGITVYRYGSKPQQVLYIGKPKKHITAHAEYAGGCPGVCTN